MEEFPAWDKLASIHVGAGHALYLQYPVPTELIYNIFGIQTHRIRKVTTSQ